MTPKGMKALLASQLVMSVCSFIRNVLLARALGVEDFGIASTFAVVIFFVEMSSDFALDRYLIQYRFGANARSLSTVHGIMVVKGFLVSCLLYLSANYLAAIFSLQEYVWGYELLALVPFVKSLANYDYALQQKRLDQRTYALMEGIPHFLSTLALLPLLYYSNDPTVIIAVTFINYFGFAFISHVKSTQKYRVRFDKVLMNEVMKFSLPLIINGIFLFMILHGDRVIVGHFYDMPSLGLYTAVFSLFSVPIIFSQRLISTWFIPLLARHLNDKEYIEYQGVARLSATICSFLAINAFVGFSLLGIPVITLIYGAEYTPEFYLVMALGASVALRIYRMPSSVISMSQAMTRNEMFCSFSRTSGVALAVYFASMGMPLFYIAASALIGELVASMLSFYLLSRLPLPFVSIDVLKDSVFFIILFGVVLSLEMHIDGDTLLSIVSYMAMFLVVSAYYLVVHRAEIDKVVRKFRPA